MYKGGIMWSMQKKKKKKMDGHIYLLGESLHM